MSTAPTQPDEIQLVLPPPASPIHGQAGTFGPMDLGILADIAAGLASPFRAEFRADSRAKPFVPDGRDGFEEIEWEGSDLRSFARLLQTPAYEAWLIAWEAAADLELHDHGGSQGAFHVVEGALVEAHTDLADPAPLRTVPIGAGEGRQVTATRVHRVWNPGPGRAVSVHVQLPPLRSVAL